MAKDKLTDYSATNASNTDIGGINIDEGMLPSAVNNSIRELMTHLKSFSDGTDAVDGISFNDSAKAQFGAGNDLQIYHDGSNSRIDDAGTGDLILRANDQFRVRQYSNNEEMIVATTDGEVKIYHDGSKKFETTSTGVAVTGNIMPDTDSSRDIGDTGSRFDQIYGDFVYITPNMNNAAVAGGFNLVEVVAYDDNSSHSLSTSMNNKMSVIQIAAGTGLTSFPIYPNGGNGIAFAYNFMDPDSASWNYTTSSISRTVNVAGSSANSFNINITSGGGAFTIQRTSGSRAYCVAISIFQQA